jgi:hypothetical protein
MGEGVCLARCVICHMTRFVGEAGRPERGRKDSAERFHAVAGAR